MLGNGSESNDIIHIECVGLVAYYGFDCVNLSVEREDVSCTASVMYILFLYRPEKHGDGASVHIFLPGDGPFSSLAARAGLQ